MLNKTNFHYPAMLRVAGKNCVIIGGGAVAARKLATLLDAEANVTVVAPLFCDEVQKLASAQGCTLIKDYYKPEYLQNAFVVIAATDNKAVNRQISEAAPCLVNNITEPELSNFTVPSAISEGDITIALATGGMPAFTRLLKKQLEHIHQMFQLTEQALEQMRTILSIRKAPREASTAYYIEREINKFRNQLRNLNFTDVNNGVYNYQTGAMYMDVINLSLIHI